MYGEGGSEWATEPSYCGQTSRRYYWGKPDLASAARICPAVDFRWEGRKHTFIFGHNVRSVQWPA
jgi:hypothetical protein